MDIISWFNYKVTNRISDHIISDIYMNGKLATIPSIKSNKCLALCLCCYFSCAAMLLFSGLTILALNKNNCYKVWVYRSIFPCVWLVMLLFPLFQVLKGFYGQYTLWRIPAFYPTNAILACSLMLNSKFALSMRLFSDQIFI